MKLVQTLRPFSPNSSPPSLLFPLRLISFAEFRSFEGLLCTPDAVNRLAFQLFDVEKKGTIGFGEYVCMCLNMVCQPRS